MALFLMNRYLGDNDDESVSNKESRSKVLLAKLQKKAKEKEKQNLPCHNDQLPELQKDSQLPGSIQKRKAGEYVNQELNQTKKSKGEITPTEPLHIYREESVEGKKKEKANARKKQKKNTESDLVNTPPDSPVNENSLRVQNAGEVKVETVLQSKQDIDAAAAKAGYTILGGFEDRPVKKVHRVLPQWLAQPDVIHRDIKSNLVPVSEVRGISDTLLKTLENNRIQHFFPVQAEVIPAILESLHQGLLIGRGGYKPRDFCVSAPTGSGKTLAFVIPVIQALMGRVVCQVRALAILPTKELAQQVFKVFTLYSEGTPLKVVLLAGQKSFSVEEALLSEIRGGVKRSLADIVVATPGRLVDHINKSSGLRLEHLRFLIIDEADRMIDSAQHFWLSQVTKAVFRSDSSSETMSIFRRSEPAHVTAASLSPPQIPLQKLLFSATLTKNPEKLQQLGLHQPRLFSSLSSCSASNTSIQCSSTGTASQTQDQYNFPEGLTEYYVPCTLSKKPLLILHFLLRMKLAPVLCFTNSREAAHRLCLLVKLFGGAEAAEFSSRLPPGERKKTLKDFEKGNIQLLVSTDAAARGIDIKGVKCVVNYDAPQFIRTYIHRIGRTARAGNVGLAFTFLLGVQEENFLQMVAAAGSPGIRKHIVKPSNLKSMEDHYKQTLLQLATVIKDEKNK